MPIGLSRIVASSLILTHNSSRRGLRTCRKFLFLTVWAKAVRRTHAPILLEIRFHPPPLPIMTTNLSAHRAHRNHLVGFG